ncbi:hypothetical protein A2833_02785 [Candidatus Azambacteria bacterium RIFCSPHIGHO2_01_FULL_44_55]|uniref:DNA polymerase III subunit delta n=1 Tax=Candidatus Azambacteria bacterium RIFCSPLOWO2_02_FULL_44_14 TaxID=1797306 RepID=A0A1F5CBS4_9BACT|nr:MAG: hypothetical protein A3A18_02675 [Candidatus Azambacteria bacterium RIFCSPLOWO2_01_FULL_44_84]OGD33215.1 MAG: hypothetical protein A3C78_03080 [Candidatus Azambacteria bacterium RIFCSPHIGHO2_02_FULL_45_18]OGD40320.1 MAG: hypothetical protein A3I30_03440 [Candidatus Azambacteria bacterium RIFCSPLOWO2_02_FULL_44_14]OGD40683.1 MAG: hypothetical protein A2833_02785 [Candidatus Azambacteria bacterium RIFCSPHIGHO2_01_FULL_44_55]OGD50394.1 MAG: hypothetical protein A2608_03510 [Candidatus Azam
MYQKTIDYLNRCTENDQLANVYLFYGPDEKGKSDTAETFAKTLLNHDDARFCPDLLKIAPDENDRIVIDKAREIKRFLSLSALAQHKVIIISGAERMAETAQSALLKVLEESPSYAIIILLAKTLDSILPTIISRSTRILFWYFEPKEARGKFSEIIEKIVASDISERYALVEKILKNEPDTSRVFAEWLNFWRESFIKKLRGDSTILTTYSTDEAAIILAKLQNIYTKLVTTNMNPKFAFDEFILSLK